MSARRRWYRRESRAAGRRRIELHRGRLTLEPPSGFCHFSLENSAESPMQVHLQSGPADSLPVQRPYATLAGEDTTVPTPSLIRDDRIELRASREEKRILAAAAAYERLDLTTFVMRTAIPAAEEVVARHERLTLSARDSVRVLRLLEHPPKPTAALRAAARSLRNRR